MKMWIIHRDLALFVMFYASAPALASLFLIPVLLPLLNRVYILLEMPVSTATIAFSNL